MLSRIALSSGSDHRASSVLSQDWMWAVVVYRQSGNIFSMGINLARTNMSAALPLALLVVLVAASSLTLSATGKYTYVHAWRKLVPLGTFSILTALSVLLAAHQQNECSPKIPEIRLPGQCLPLRQCAYFMRILSAPTVSQADRQLLRESQCNEDKNVHVRVPSYQLNFYCLINNFSAT